MSTDRGAPQLIDYELLGRDDDPFTIRGTLLGFATSKRDIHTHMTQYTDEREIEAALGAYELRLGELPQRFADSPKMLAQSTASLERYINTELCGAQYPTRYAAPGDRCSACRWFEVRIFKVEGEYNKDNACNCSGGGAEINGAHESHCGMEPARAQYLLLTYGLSDVPGEVAKRRDLWTPSQYSLIEALTQRRGGQAFLPATSARVLAEAAAMDSDVADAYINRAVA